MKLLEHVKELIDITGTIFETPAQKPVLEMQNRREHA
jgi:hypothetical protein